MKSEGVSTTTNAGEGAEPAPGRDFAGIDTWIFDLDNTLYPAECDLFSQVSDRMGEYIASFLGVDREAARRLQKQYFAIHGTTMRGMMVEHAMDPLAFLDYVHDIDVTAVAPDPALADSITRLPGRKFVFTNGSVAHADRVMGRLGVAHLFDGVFDIVASDFVPKPHPEPYRKMVEELAIEPTKSAFFEDIARNLEPAAQLGMTTVWVKSETSWGRADADFAHVHHVAENLADWLARLVASSGRPRGG